MRKLIIIRRLSQIFFLALFIYILWSATYPLNSIFPPDTFFKIDPLIIIFTSISGRTMLAGLASVTIVLLLTLVLGRFFCGWVCPLGSIIDLCGSINKKKPVLNETRNKILRSIKYFILGIIAAFSFVGLQVTWILDPMVILARFVSLNLIPALMFGIDRASIFIIRQINFYGPIYDFYRLLKSSILGIHVYYFSHSAVILVFFLLIIASSFMLRRFWCRGACPLGAIYAMIARFSILRRRVDECIDCFKCRDNCRMQAIKEVLSYKKSECILCMDCIYDCPTNKTRFTFYGRESKKLDRDLPKEGLSRREFLFLLAGGLLSLGFIDRVKMKGSSANVIRPPGVLKEEDFLNRCVRCGNCMRTCISNGLQPVIFESGIAGIWTPKLVPEIGYCEYNCNLCGRVCPTGAIPALELKDKKKMRLGLAEINRSICIAWSQDMECIVCQEHCPIPEKAIKLTPDKKPQIDDDLCIGCGICQNKCPIRPVRAIRVSPLRRV